MERLFLTICIVLCYGTLLHAQKKNLKPVVFYLENLPQKRIGQMTDAAIIDSMRRDGFIVATVDCKYFPLISPDLEEKLIEFHKTTPELLKQYNTDTTEANLDCIYYVPEGYILKNGIKVWNFLENGASGTDSIVLRTYNEIVVPKYHIKPVNKIEDMRDRYGRPINWNLCMDIIYPSGKTTNQLPLLLNFSSNSPRQKPFNPVNEDEIVFRNIFPFGFLTTGYAFATVDHAFNPIARGDVWGYFKSYSLDAYNSKAAYTAFVRYIKGHLSEYNLNGKIGTMGISKASLASIRISNTKNADAQENKLINNKTNTKKQPWKGFDSKIDVCYAAAGDGTRNSTNYVNENTVPTIFSAGFSDKFKKWDELPFVIQSYKKYDLIYLPMWMEDLGHTYPGMGIDYGTGIKRYVLFKQFFDNYLKPDSSSEPLKIFYIYPKESAEDVNTKGYSRIISTVKPLPNNMLGLTAYEPITLRFLSEIDINNIKTSVKIIEQKSKAQVKGNWNSIMKGTAFTFEPQSEFKADQTYQIIISPSLKNKKGQKTKQEIIREFKINN